MQRFNLSTRVDGAGNVQVELHDRMKRPLFNLPFADDQLGGGILTVRGHNIATAAEVCDALNTLDRVPADYMSPAVMRSALDVIEEKRVENQVTLDELTREHWKTDEPATGDITTHARTLGETIEQ